MGWIEEREEGLKREVKAWVQWSREHIVVQRTIPPISARGEEAPWLEGLDELFESADSEGTSGFRDNFVRMYENELAYNPSDLATRFTALSFYYGLIHAETYSIYSEDFLEEHRDRHRKHLAYFVRMVSPEQCDDWRTVRWEILNSYAIRDWERASDLYSRAKAMAMLDSTDILLLRAQLGFFRVFESDLVRLFDSKIKAIGESLSEVMKAEVNENKLRDVNWKHVLFPFGLDLESLELQPEIYDSSFTETKSGYDLTKSLKIFVSLMLGMTSSAKHNPLPASRKALLRDVVKDVENALDSKTEIPVFYRLLLARSLFAIDRFQDSARAYEEALKTGVSFEPLLPKLYESTLIALKKAGNTARREAIAQRFCEKYPNERQAYISLADAQADNSEFKAAYESLRKALEIDPNLEEEIGFRVGVALGGIIEDQDRLLEQIKPDRRDSQLIRSVLARYWPTFEFLEDRSRDEWILGTFQSFFFETDAGTRQGFLRNAALSFARALEIELRTKVFSRFRSESRKKPDVLNQARRAIQERDRETGLFAQILLEDSEESKLALGQMLFVVDRARKSSKGVFRLFDNWLLQHFPAIRTQEQVDHLKRINDFRVPATHEGVAAVQPEMITKLCRHLIEALLRDANPVRHRHR